ncbi:AAA family ATPase [Fulvimarina sp. MAC8]|uniref:AAA family ATPase n=1 Tax=Fulvimarina sp. MAC8 TaxID=3162874 RepID=UPI0032EBEC57
MLIVFGGLPGTGKSTIAKALVANNAFAYVRVDEIENALALKSEPKREVGAKGYQVAFAVSLSNFRLGNCVVADSVNPVRASRDGGRHVAEQAGVPIVEVECVCSDETEHRKRVETRVSDPTGWVLPSWAHVRSREYQPWDRNPLVIDTAHTSPAEAVRTIDTRIAAAQVTAPPSS